MNQTYCPVLFVVGEKTKSAEVHHYAQMITNNTCGRAGIVVVGNANDELILDSKTLLGYGITPASVVRIVLVCLEITILMIKLNI